MYKATFRLVRIESEIYPTVPKLVDAAAVKNLTHLLAVVAEAVHLITSEFVRVNLDACDSVFVACVLCCIWQQKVIVWRAN